MSGRILWFSAAALLMLLGTASTEPVWARGGGGGGGGHGGFGRTGRVVASRGHGLRGALRSDIVGARTIARNLGVRRGAGFNQNGFGFGQNGFGFGGNGSLRGSQLGFWPFWPYFDTSSMGVAPVESVAPSDPFVIAIPVSSDRPPERATANAAPDYGYVAECRAIPNGYHCDFPHDQAAP